MSAQQTSRMYGGSAVQLLRLASRSSDMIPPVKSIVDGALRIAELVVQFKTSQDEWKEFQVYVQNAVATVLHSMASIDNSQSEARVRLEKFQVTLGGIVKKIETKQSEPLAWRMIRFLDHPIMIAEMRKEVDDAVILFNLGGTIRLEIAIEKVLELLKQNNKPHEAPIITCSSTLSKLQRIDGASWDPYRVCLEHTRTNIIEMILAWLSNVDGVDRDKKILLLTGVAGSGKSTIAHTIAQKCEENRQLGSSFFFDRDTSDRNNPKHLISTIAADLCSTDDRLARRIMAVVEGDERVVHAPISRQFEKMILEPCNGFSAQSPVIIILDALDEGCNQDLLRIICDDARKLPASIRIFLTSRMSPFMENLRRKSHVHSMTLDIYEKNNMDDIAVFVPHKLSQVAEYHGLTDWPDPELSASFQDKAGGLFLWVATTCDYLNTCYDPTRELHNLVSAAHLSGSSAESMMDKLYTTILQACNWSDKDFVDGFHRLMGAAIATKTPLTLRALNALYQRPLMPSNLALRQLSPLLTGLIDERDGPQLVRFLHQSLRDFLTLRAGTQSALIDGPCFAIDEKTHSQVLALLCLSLMNRELDKGIPGVGYLAKDQDSPGIPLIREGDISEELWYACRFWIEHILDNERSALSDALEQLELFIDTKLTLWVELMAACGQYEGLSTLQDFVKAQCDQYPTLKPLLYNTDKASMSRGLAERLQYMGRREEALAAARDEVEIYRRLAQDGEDGSQAELARSLCNLSIYLTDLAYLEDAFGAAVEAVTLQRQLRLPGPGLLDADLARSLWRLAVAWSELGKHQEGLEAIEESINLQRKLMSDQNTRTRHMPGLAKSLHALSAVLNGIGRYEDALQSSQEEVDIYRKLLTERPAEFICELARSLHSLSCDLFSLGRHEEALTTIQEAVDLRRQLASERPSVFTSDLAKSLHGLSCNLSVLGRHEEALTTGQETVNLRRQLASERPAVFTSGLAECLHGVSCYLSNLGRHEEALTAIQEAVDLRRQLASGRPTVFTTDLAVSLHNLSCCLSNLDRHQEALAPMQEAVQLYRPAVADRPAVFTPGLASALSQLAFCLSKLGDDQAALVAMRESVELYRPLAEQNPSIYAIKLSNELRYLAWHLSHTGGDAEAQAIRQELEAISLPGE